MCLDYLVFSILENVICILFVCYVVRWFPSKSLRCWF